MPVWSVAGRAHSTRGEYQIGLLESQTLVRRLEVRDHVSSLSLEGIPHLGDRPDQLFTFDRRYGDEPRSKTARLTATDAAIKNKSMSLFLEI